jgi:hypothetical protein
MKTNLGFDLTTILTRIISRNTDSRGFDFEELCKTFSGGSDTYQDPVHGEHGYFYQFSRKRLAIEIIIAEHNCICGHNDSVDCECDSYDDQEFEDWQSYWNSVHEIIVLKEKDLHQYRNPTLF